MRKRFLKGDTPRAIRRKAWKLLWQDNGEFKGRNRAERRRKFREAWREYI